MQSTLPKVKFFNLLDWTLFFGLCALSVYLMIEVFEKYIFKKSNFARSEESITELPVITFCISTNTENGKEYQLGKDFNATYIFKNGENKTLIEGKKFSVEYEEVELESIFIVNYITNHQRGDF